MSDVNLVTMESLKNWWNKSSKYKIVKVEPEPDFITPEGTQLLIDTFAKIVGSITDIAIKEAAEQGRDKVTEEDIRAILKRFGYIT